MIAQQRLKPLSDFGPGRLSKLILGLVCTQCLLSGATGGVAGTVVDDSGRPVAGARVLISHTTSIKAPVAAPPVITGSLAATATTDPNGTFRVDSLPPGQYIACSEAPVSGHLDPCHWSTAAPNLTISAGETTSGVTIVMPKGAVLSVQVTDPRKLLQPVAGPIDLALEIQVVTSKGLHYSAPIQSNSATGRSYAITVPFGTPLTLRVLSSHYTINDQSGQPVAATGTTLNVPAGSTPSALAFTVTGTK